MRQLVRVRELAGDRQARRGGASDPAAKLPHNYRFTAADQGVHTFTGLRSWL